MNNMTDFTFFAEAGSATVHEAHDRLGDLDPAIAPVISGAVVAGPAFCAICERGDNLAIHRAIAQAAQGDILVAAGHGVACGYLGDILAEAAMLRGIRAIVVDGYVRDAAELRKMGFPVWARGLAIRGADKASPGLIGTDIHCGGVRIQPGDLIVADDDGVCAVPRASIAQVAQKTAARLEKERSIRAQLQEGRLTLDIMGLREQSGA